MSQTRYLFLFAVLGAIIAALAGLFWIQLAIAAPHPCGDPVRAVISGVIADNSQWGSNYAVHASDESGHVYQLMVPIAGIEVGDRVNLQLLCTADGKTLPVATLIPHSLRRQRDAAGA
tara:strand:+ start:946 stop:1299 length:354 start_codon:yes stop_codon:yes gene_type:complete